MAVTPIPAFTVDASVGASASTTTSRVALPGTLGSDSVVRVSNLGANHIFVKVGDNTVTATNQDLAVPAGQTQYLALGTATNIAAITSAFSSTFNIATGN